MSERNQRMFAATVAANTVTLNVDTRHPMANLPAGTGINHVVITTTESTADSAFWGTTGSCGRFIVTFKKVS